MSLSRPAKPIAISVSDLATALSDPFGLWHDHHGDPALKDPEAEYDLFLKEQGRRVELELLRKRHPAYVNLTSEPSAAAQTKKLIAKDDVVIYHGELEDSRTSLRGRPDVIIVSAEAR